MTPLPVLTLKSGRERSLLRHHPWIFSGAVQSVEGNPGMGDTVQICSSDGTFLGRGAFSPCSAIRARVWSTEEQEEIDESFFRRRIESAFLLRRLVFGAHLPDAYRLIHAESDGLPGVVCDIYAGYAVCQFSSAGAEKFRETIADILHSGFAPNGVYERSDADSRIREGLPCRVGLLRGNEPPESISFSENGILFRCNVRTGHKTGFYLDQRENRLAVRRAASGAQDVLNCFSYTGGFGLAALAGGAGHVLNVDTSADALRIAAENAEQNGFSPDRFECLEADVFSFLRKCRDSRRTFDFIILDPPKFADSASHLNRAARGYKDINLLAMKLLRPGGMLFTFSCSGAMEEPLFAKVVDGAALDAGIDFRIVRYLSQSPDHPVSSAVPEGRYLKGIAGVRI